MTATNRLLIELMESGQVTAEVLFNQAELIQDAFSGILEVLTVGDTAPPTLPASYDSSHGALYITASSGCTGAWDGQNDKFALGINESWYFLDLFTCLFYDLEPVTPTLHYLDETGTVQSFPIP